jgi:hypothetical protein
VFAPSTEKPNSEYQSALGNALIAASHAESSKGMHNDLLQILNHDNHPWGFSYSHYPHGVNVWYGDKDEKIAENAVRWMEKNMGDKCSVKVVKGADHALMYKSSVVVEVLEQLMGYWQPGPYISRVGGLVLTIKQIIEHVAPSFRFALALFSSRKNKCWFLSIIIVNTSPSPSVHHSFGIGIIRAQTVSLQTHFLILASDNYIPNLTSLVPVVSRCIWIQFSVIGSFTNECVRTRRVLLQSK